MSQLEHGRDKTWVVFTMTGADALFEDDGSPALDWPEWSIGFDVDKSTPWFARSGCIVAERMEYDVAVYVCEMHNATLESEARNG